MDRGKSLLKENETTEDSKTTVKRYRLSNSQTADAEREGHGGQ